MNRLSFTLKWAKSLAFMSAVHARLLPEAISTRRCIILYGLWAACHWWSVHSCCDKLEVWCRECLNLSRLRYGCQWCTLAVAQHCSSPTSAPFNFQEIFKCSFKIYGLWPQANKYVTHTLPQCSPASVELTQACPNTISAWSATAPNWTTVSLVCVFYIKWWYWESNCILNRRTQIGRQSQ